ncbi:MAG: hypothetical protein KGO53_12835 [Alphaproteobacteria bacterium]|nr:hypothetical protein [Alphaproteobacteria bacterium]
MKAVLKISLAAALAMSSLAAAAPQASAHERFHHEGMCEGDILPLLFVGAALGAVTGGVGSAVAWGSAYAVGGAAVGGGAGLLLTTAHDHHHCH